MAKQIKVVVANDDTIYLDGQELVERAALVDALRSAVQSGPDLVLVIEPQQPESYKGIGKVIYASQFAGVPVGSLRFTMQDGEVVSFAELQARGPASPE
jgi:biopolymer transport protein ExbD